MKKRSVVTVFSLLLAAALFLAAGCEKKQETGQEPSGTQPVGSLQPASPAQPKAVTQPAPEEPPALPDKDQISYALGMQIGSTLKGGMGLGTNDVNPEALARAIDDVAKDRPPLLTDEERMSLIHSQMETQRQRMEEVNQERRNEMEAERQRWEEQAARNLEEGKRFLEENAGKEGVVVLPSGLQYKVIREGTGVSPAPTDTVKFNYRGTFIDGKEFDNSYTRGEPLTVAVARLIPGWVEALPLMKEGAKWELYIPSDLGYGQSMPGGDMPPNATLIFEMELLEVVK